MTASTPQHDLHAIVRSARSGSERAYRQIFELHVDALFRFLGQFSRSPDELDEWVQRAFIKAFENLHTFDSKRRFEPWLFQIAINEMKMDKRRAAILPFVASSDEPIAPQFTEQFEWTMTMKGLLDGLDDLRRSVFVLFEVEGFSHNEIASMLNISESHSRTILTRTKAELRAMLNEERNVS